MPARSRCRSCGTGCRLLRSGQTLQFEAAPQATTIQLSEAASTAEAADMPEVVVTASREQPKSIG